MALAGVDADADRAPRRGLARGGGRRSPTGAIERLGADLGIGITGIAGPGGGTEDKPVGTVCLSVAERGGARLDRSLQLPGNRAMVRERTTTVAMHLLRRLLDGARD